MTTRTEPTYGVEVSTPHDTHYYLGSDEALWDWANAPVSPDIFTLGLAEIPLPEGYVVIEDEGEDKVIQGGPDAGLPWALISAESTYDDKAYVLTCGITSVSRTEFNAAGLSDERIIRTTAF